MTTRGPQAVAPTRLSDTSVDVLSPDWLLTMTYDLTHLTPAQVAALVERATGETGSAAYDAWTKMPSFKPVPADVAASVKKELERGG